MEECRISTTQELITKLKEQVSGVETKELADNRIEVVVPANEVRNLAEKLNTIFPDVSGELVSGVDLTEDKYEVLWFLWSHSQKQMVILKTMVEGTSPKVASLTDLWPGLDWHERETWEMYGVEFEGHPNLDLLLLSEDLRGKFPLRKSFVINRDRINEASVAPPRPQRPAKEEKSSEESKEEE